MLDGDQDDDEYLFELLIRLQGDRIDSQRSPSPGPGPGIDLLRHFGLEETSRPSSRDRPREHVCPITRELMSDPVVAEDGNTYERAAIENWFTTKSTSPLTNEPMGPTVFPNRAIKKLIDEWGGPSSNTLAASASAASARETSAPNFPSAETPTTTKVWPRSSSPITRSTRPEEISSEQKHILEQMIGV